MKISKSTIFFCAFFILCGRLQAQSLVTQASLNSISEKIDKYLISAVEAYKFNGVASQNHPMFGSIDEWFYKFILGINAASPGFEKIVIKPQSVKELTWAKGNYQSVRGIISSDWEKDANKFLLRVSIPANTTAEIWLPAKESEPINENGKLISEIKEVKLVRYENGYAVIAVGDYLFNVN